MRRIILASKSPRRIDLLKQLGLKFEVIPSNIDEKKYISRDPEKSVKKIALMKANDVAKKNKNGIVIGSDTIVVFKGKIIGKPKNKNDAFKTLKKFSGKEHEVVTGLAIIDTISKKTLIDSVKTKVKFRKITDDEINDFIATGEPFDKAGGYGIQNFACIFIESVNGCFYNVVGLPLSKLTEMLKHFNINILKSNKK
jgi:septum formation protein